MNQHKVVVRTLRRLIRIGEPLDTKTAGALVNYLASLTDGTLRTLHTQALAGSLSAPDALALIEAAEKLYAAAEEIEHG